MKCPVISIVVAAGIFLTGVTTQAELRIMAHVGERVIPVTGVENNRIVGTENGQSVPLTHDAVFELVGDLQAHADLVVWSPSYSITLADAVKQPIRPGVYALAAAHIRHLAELDGKKMKSEFSATWPRESGEGGLMVTAWLVNSKITQLAVTKVPATRAAKFFFAGRDFELTEAEAGGQAVMLLWEQGRFIPPIPRFDDARAQRALVDMLLGNSTTLQSALSAGLKPSVKGANSVTLLHFAAEAGMIEAVDLLLRHGAKVNAINGSGQTALHWAARNGRLAVIERLLAAKASMVTDTNSDMTPLHTAILGGHRGVARALINRGAEVNAANEEHESPYTMAIDRGYADLAELMLSHGVNSKAYDQTQMQRVLVTQAAKGHTAMVRFLLGQKVNPRAEVDGTSALGAAALSGDAELVKVLLQGGAGIDDISSDGRTALLSACVVGNIDFARALLKGGANVNVQTKDGRSGLSFAATRNLPEMAELLLAHGADLAARDSEGRSPLDLALLSGFRAVAEMLADHGATIDLKSTRAPVLIEAALKMDLAGLIRVALAAGWSRDSRFHDVWPALILARACGAKECVATLEQAGADRSPPGAPVLTSAREIDSPPKLVAGVAADDFRDPDTEFPASLIHIDIVLDPQGRVLFPVVKSGADWRLDNAALRAVSLWRFTPVTKAGQPVAVRLTLPVEFPASGDLAIKPQQADLLPVPLKRESPVYPTELSRSGQVGRVNLTFTVETDGLVRKARVRASSHPAFDQPALDAVSKWIFKPGERDGKSVAVRMEQEIVFSLN